MLYSLARQISQRRLTVPAILFLEVARPLGFLCSQALLLVAPLLDPLTDRSATRYARVLRDERQMEALLHLLQRWVADPEM